MKIKITLIALLCPLFMFSQNISDEKRKKIEIQKIAFITKALDLSSEEAQVFWPVYNNFSDEMKTIKERRREVFSKYAIKSFLESSTSEIVVSILLKSVIKTSKIPNVGTRVLS